MWLVERQKIKEKAETVENLEHLIKYKKNKIIKKWMKKLIKKMKKKQQKNLLNQTTNEKLKKKFNNIIQNND